MINLLVENGADANPQYVCCDMASVAKSDNSPQMSLSVLQNAIVNNSAVDVLKILIDGGADINAPDGIFGNAFSIAVDKGRLDILQLLIANSSDIDAYSYEKGLNTAVGCHNLRLVQFLIQNGGNVDTHNEHHGSILQLATALGQEDIVRFLMRSGAGVNFQGGHGSALHAAVYGGSKEMVRLLLEGGANLEPQNHHGNALQMAIQLTHYDIAKTLAEKASPSEINAQGGRYGNCLSIAITRGHHGLVKL